MSEPILPIQDRDTVGRGAARRLRRAGMVPGVVYGGARKTRSIVVSAKDLAANLKNESFHSSVVSLTRDDSKRPIKALLRAIQMHPTRAEPAHVDFQAVRADREISAAAPLRFINIETAPGVKLAARDFHHDRKRGADSLPAERFAGVHRNRCRRIGCRQKRPF